MVQLLVKHVENKWRPFRMEFSFLPPVGTWMERVGQPGRYTVLSVGPSENWTPEEYALLQRLGTELLHVVMVEDERIPNAYPAARRVG